MPFSPPFPSTLFCWVRKGKAGFSRVQIIKSQKFLITRILELERVSGGHPFKAGGTQLNCPSLDRQSS